MNKLCVKYIILIVCLICFKQPALCIEEIVLENDEKNYFDYLSDVYYGKVEQTEDVPIVLRLFSQEGLKFENSPINSIKANFLYSQNMSYEHIRGEGQSLKHNFPIVEPMLSVKFNDNKSSFMADYNITREIPGYSNKFTQKVSRFYVAHQITPNQTILIGQGARLPSSYDGSLPTYGLDLILKSQLGRTFGDRVSVGIRNIATYDYLDYDIGFYDSTQYMKDFGEGFDFTGNVMFKPFPKTDENKPNIKFGAGYANGKNHISYNMYSVYALGNYKKFNIKAEYANSDGYNAVSESPNKADGFYTLLSYSLTPKLKLIGRYDYFTPDKNQNNLHTNEYTAGITYYVFKNFKIMVNYVKRINSTTSDTDMILFATRFII